MSFFDGFVSGAAESASGIIGQQMRDDSELKKQQAFAQFQADLAERKAITLQKLQRELDMKAGKDIGEEAERIGADRMSKKYTALKNDPEINGIQDSDAQDLANASQSQLKEVGINNSRADQMDDRASAAEKLGYLQWAKDARGQQQIEVSRDQNERLLEAGQMRDAHQMRRDVTADKRAVNSDAYQNKHLEEIIRHNKALEGAARERSGTEKLSPAAKAALELAGTGLSVAKMELNQAINEQTKVLTKEYSDPEQKKIDLAAAGTRIVDARREMDGSKKFYNATMGTYLDGYKPVEVVTENKEQKEKKVYPVPNEQAIKYLFAHPEAAKSFQDTYGSGAIPQDFFQQRKPSTEQTQPKGSRMGSGERNPYIDERGRALPQQSTDGTNAIDRNLPKIKGAIDDASNAAQLRYLKQKIKDGNLSAADKVRAKRLGLID